jgi:uncharacterized protein (TIGR00297 family)
LVGTPIFGFGGIVWGALLVAFFVSSSALSQFHSRSKTHLADMFQKGTRRDLMQALANGGWAALLAVIYAAWHAETLFAAFVGALATVTADTWATEIGVLSPQAPRLLTNGRKVPAGTSGGVTILGTTTAFFGAAFIGACGVVVAAVVSSEPRLQGATLQHSWLPSHPVVIGALAAASGLFGSLFDSLLGAKVQAIYYCDFDRKETERRVHSCGRKTRLLRGPPWMDNDAVNFLSSVFGSVVAVLIWALVFSGIQVPA